MNTKSEPSYWQMREMMPESIYDRMIRESINKADGRYDEATGHYATLAVKGIASLERAREMKTNLRKAAFYHYVSLAAKIEKKWDGSCTLTYVVVNKSHARNYMRQKHPYSYRGRKKRY